MFECVHSLPRGVLLPSEVLARHRAELDELGWTLIRGAGFLRAGRPDERVVLDLAGMFGVPSARDGGRAVWRVTPAPDGAGGTFSVRVGPAGFHTDSQYHQEPEDFVCLFGVRPGADGGQSGLLRYDDAISALMSRPDGAELLAAMRRPAWRWRTPAGFAGTANPPAAVLPGAGRIRWRADNLEPFPEQVRRHVPDDAAARIAEAFESAAGRVRLDLLPDEMLIVDNHRVMHARTGFTDPGRLLLRVRLWEMR